jgi:adenylate cyclase
MSGTKAPDPTGRPLDRRRLVAVVYADMVGYSRLIGLDDTGTLERLRALRREVIDPAIDEHGGRIVNTGGDSLLLVFDSAEGAVRCAIKVQQQLPIYDGDQPADRAIRFRVGIHVGDAIADGTDIHGDVVNVAARLQAECPTGAICVSRPVRDHIRDTLGLVFEELGALSLKNIARPVEAYSIRPLTTAISKSVERILVHGTEQALPLPDKPSLAVLAFNNTGGDTEQEYFADGVAEDIIAALSRCRSLFVIARSSSFTYKGRAVDVKQVARELGVRYVLEGSVRRSGTRVRVIAQLVETEAGNHIWAERYDRALEDVFAVQDEITMAVVTAIEPAISDAELRRILRKRPESLGAWEAYQRGLWHMAKWNATDNERAKALLHRATELDSTLGVAYSALAYLYLSDGLIFFARSLRDTAELAGEWARKAIDINPDDSDALAVLAQAAQFRDIREALELASLALTSAMNSPWANSAKGAILIDNGSPAEGREFLLKSLRLSPRDPLNANVLNHIARSYYWEADYDSAVNVSTRLVTRYANHPTAYIWLAAGLGQSGRLGEAHEALKKAIEVSLRSVQMSVQIPHPWRRPEDHAHMLDGLRKAGWQG